MNLTREKTISKLRNHIVDVEVRTPIGRVDMVMRTGKTLYLFEVKLNQSVEAAMNQIDLKDYPSRFAMCGLPIIKVSTLIRKSVRLGIGRLYLVTFFE